MPGGRFHCAISQWRRRCRRRSSALAAGQVVGHGPPPSRASIDANVQTMVACRSGLQPHEVAGLRSQSRRSASRETLKSAILAESTGYPRIFTNVLAKFDGAA
jgi:hypothetical protein